MPPDYTMTPERWERVKTLYDTARARPAHERVSYLSQACLGDDELQRDVQSLLDQPVDTAGFVGLVGGTPLAHAIQVLGDASVPLTGRRFGTFEVKSLLGRGGMGEVYRAHDTRLGRDVAIKVLPSRSRPTPLALRAWSARRAWWPR